MSRAIPVIGSLSSRSRYSASASAERFGVADVSAYHALPSLLTAIVLNSGMPWYSRCAATNSSKLWAIIIARYCSANSSLSMFASR